MEGEPIPGMHVRVDMPTGGHTITHSHAPSMSAVLALPDGDIAEVQIAVVQGFGGYGLNIVIAGDVERPGRTDARGNTIIQVFPTAKK